MRCSAKKNVNLWVDTPNKRTAFHRELFERVTRAELWEVRAKPSPNQRY